MDGFPFPTMLIHAVYFWLRRDLTAAERASFREGVESLGKCASLKFFHVGTVADTTRRPIIDTTYDFALVTGFENIAGEAAYQVDPIHLKFIADHNTKWVKVTIYDSAS